MAVGKVGSFATVEPAIVDFGGMAKSAIDSVKEDRERKRREQEAGRAKKQQLLDKLSVPELEMLNINGVQDQRYDWYKSQVSEFARLKKEEDYNGAQRLIASLESEANAVKQTNAKIKYYTDNEGKLDSDYLKKATDLTVYVDKARVDLIDKGDGEIRYNIYEDDKKTKLLYEAITPFEYVSKIEVPFKFDPTKLAESFSQTFRDDEIETFFEDKGKLGTIKVEDVLKNERILNRIDTKANELVNDNTAMAFYGKTISKFEPRAANYTDEEKEDAKKYWKTILSDAYRKKIDISIQQKRGGGGAGGKDSQFNFGTPELFPNIAGIKNAMYSDIIASGSKKGGIYFSASEDIVGIALNPADGKMYPITAASVGLSTSIGTGDGGTRQGAGTSGRASELRPIETETSRNATLKRIATDKRFKTVKELQENLFGQQGTSVKFN